MIGQKLIKILQMLNPKAFRRLGDAFNSPYFTSSALLVKLYALLKKAYPDFDSSRLNKEKVFRALYPDKAFNDGALRVLVREFTRITEDFLLFEALKNDEITRQKALTQWYGDHNLYAEFEKGTQALLSKLHEKPYRDVEYFKDIADLCAASFFHLQTEKHTLDDQLLVQLMESTDKGYLLLKLRLASEMKNRERILSKQYELPLLEEVLGVEAGNLLEGNAPYALYCNLLTMYETEKNTEAFHALKALFMERTMDIRAFDQSLLLTQLINYAVRELNGGNTAFSKEIFDLYRVALKHQLVLSNGKMEAGVYQNIVSAGCKEMEYAWTAQFIREYAPFLETAIRQDCQTMALAYLCFCRLDYDQTIELINTHRFFNLLLQMNTRIILVKAWFEKFLQDSDNYDLLVYQIDANEKFIRRNSVISGLKKEENLNFLQITKKIATFFYHNQSAPYIRNRLNKYMEANQRLLSKDWLQLKISQYENK